MSHLRVVPDDEPPVRPVRSLPTISRDQIDAAIAALGLPARVVVGLTVTDDLLWVTTTEPLDKPIASTVTPGGTRYRTAYSITDDEGEPPA